MLSSYSMSCSILTTFPPSIRTKLWPNWESVVATPSWSSNSSSSTSCISPISSPSMSSTSSVAPTILIRNKENRYHSDIDNKQSVKYNLRLLIPDCRPLHSPNLCQTNLIANLPFSCHDVRLCSAWDHYLRDESYRVEFDDGH